MNRSYFLRFALVAAALSVLCGTVQAQSKLFFSSVDASAFPQMQALVRVADGTTNGQVNLSSSDFSLTENGQNIPALSVQCPPLTPVPNLSAVLVMDVSGSMGSGNPTNMSLAQTAALSWVSLLSAQSECAVISFDHQAYLNQDFTSNKQDLNTAIRSLVPSGGTVYDQGLISTPMSALPLIKGRKNKPVVIFLTDGMGFCSADSVINLAKYLGVQIFCVCVNLNAPPELGRIASETGGLLYDHLTNESQIVDAYQDIFTVDTKSHSCVLQWRSTRSCETSRDLELHYLPLDLKQASQYTVDIHTLPGLNCNPLSLHFDSIQVGVSMTRSLVIMAMADSTRVDSANCSSSYFTIEGLSLPILLMKGESRSCTVRCLSPDSALHSCTINFAGNFCAPAASFARCGYPHYRGNTEKMSVVYPNGAERFLGGSIQTIRWKGLLPDDPVRLEYSINNGSSWTLICDTASNLAYDWQVPMVNSTQCLIRATQLQLLHSTDSLLFIHRAHIGAASAVAFSPEGSLIASVGADNILRVWDSYGGVPFGSSASTMSTVGVPTSVAWSVDPNIIAIAGNSAAALYNSTTLSSFHRIPSALVGNQSLNSCDFTTDGNYLLLSTNLAHVIVWSLDNSLDSTKSFINLSTTHSAAIRSVRAQSIQTTSNTSTIRFVCASEDRHMTLSSVDLTKQGNSLISPSSQIGIENYTAADQMWSASCSPTNSMVVGGALNGEMLIGNNGVLQSYFPVQGDAINQTAWSPDGKTIAMGYNSGRIVLWDVATNRVRAQLDTNHASLLGLAWDPFSSRIAASYYDGTVLVWRLGPTALQKDLSDATFSIVLPSISHASLLDFGSVDLGKEKDSVLQTLACIDPQGLSTPWKISQCRILNDADTAFSLVSALPEARSDAQAFCLAIEFRFHPKRSGIATARAEFLLNDSLMSVPLQGNGLQPALLLASDVIDFGTVNSSSHRDSTVLIVLKNSTPDSLHLHAIRVTGPDRTQFQLLSTSDSVLAPAQKATVALRFQGLRLGRTSSTLFGVVDVLNDSTKISQTVQLGLFGNVICGADSSSPKLNTHIVLSDTALHLGDAMDVWLMLDATPTQLQSVSSDCSLQLNFRSSTMALLDPPVPSNDLNGSQVLWLQGTRSADTLIHLRVLPLLGDSDRVDIQIDSVVFSQVCGLRFNGAAITVPIANICMAGGHARLLSATAVTTLRAWQQSDNSISLALSLAESGRTQVELYDLLGRKLCALVDNELHSGDQLMHCSTLNIPDGSYVLHLQTPSESRTCKLQVQH